MTPSPRALVIFGASGDLSRRKILPALYNLTRGGLLPEGSAIVGYARAEMGNEEFRRRAQEAVAEFSRAPLEETAWKRFAGSLTYLRGEYEAPRAFEPLEAHVSALRAERGIAGGPLFYCATPPSSFPSIIRRLAEVEPQDDSRVLIEKPFGHDLASARKLNRLIHEVFHERQIYRIDHYLGKETVQNILVLRFANSLFERIWNRDAIDHVQFTVAESIGVEGRGVYYEEAGALRDLLQNHMLQVLAFLTMEPPRSLEPEAFRDEKVKLLKTIRPIDPADVVRGQYMDGVLDEIGAQGYREEPGVAPESTVETFVAARLYIDNWRWAGVPFLLRHGKRLPRRVSEVAVSLRDAPPYLFEGIGIAGLPANHITLRIQPNEGVSLSVQAKEPGPSISLKTVLMDFQYGESFMGKPAEAYERLIHDAIHGDHTLFAREDGVERTWEIVERALGNPSPLRMYSAGTWGPDAAHKLIAPRSWHLT